MRLQKYLADCGFGSRRACEVLIDSGVVSVDGVVVSRQGVQVVPCEQEVRVRGKLAVSEKRIYLIMNKPRGILCTSDDPRGRRTFRDLLPHLPSRIYTVGRLDLDSEGLLIITNDGELCNRLIHPRHHVPKLYSAILTRRLSEREMDLMRKGMRIDGERMRMTDIRFHRRSAKGVAYRITLKEGKNRQIRRMISAVGVQVKRLRRLQIGPLKLGELKAGESRFLAKSELARLREAAGMNAATGRNG